jgi:hypothetical protein
MLYFMYNPGGRMKRLMNWLGVGIILVVGCERQLDPYYSDRPELQLEAVDIGCKDVMLRLTTSKAGTGGRLNIPIYFNIYLLQPYSYSYHTFTSNKSTTKINRDSEVFV